MRPDTQCAAADVLAVEVVAGVFDDKADVLVACEVDGELDMAGCAGVDDVDGPAALGAG